MKTQIKRIGSSSLGIIIPKEMVKYLELNVADWVEISDIYKITTSSKHNKNKKRGCEIVSIPSLDSQLNKNGGVKNGNDK
jgi:antitoxin component of MazEF toxin-antitoxin module